MLDVMSNPPTHTHTFLLLIYYQCDTHTELELSGAANKLTQHNLLGHRRDITTSARLVSYNCTDPHCPFIPDRFFLLPSHTRKYYVVMLLFIQSVFNHDSSDKTLAGQTKEGLTKQKFHHLRYGSVVTHISIQTVYVAGVLDPTHSFLSVQPLLTINRHYPHRPFILRAIDCFQG